MGSELRLAGRQQEEGPRLSSGSAPSTQETASGLSTPPAGCKWDFCSQHGASSPMDVNEDNRSFLGGFPRPIDKGGR